MGVIGDEEQISIHAPTRGATFATVHGFGSEHNFNPRSHKGSDVGEEEYSLKKVQFQSTLPQGERLQFSPILGLVLR